MSKTIVQSYGPIYGEPVNGTVMGRPNGSVYVPLSNTIQLSCTTDYIKSATYLDSQLLAICTSDGTTNFDLYCFSAAAKSQDLSSNIVVEVYSDAGLETKIGTAAFPAGLFNFSYNNVSVVPDSATPSAGDTLYLIARLMNNNTPVAISSAIELEYVA